MSWASLCFRDIRAYQIPIGRPTVRQTCPQLCVHPPKRIIQGAQPFRTASRDTRVELRHSVHSCIIQSVARSSTATYHPHISPNSTFPPLFPHKLQLVVLDRSHPMTQNARHKSSRYLCLLLPTLSIYPANPPRPLKLPPLALCHPSHPYLPPTHRHPHLRLPDRSSSAPPHMVPNSINTQHYDQNHNRNASKSPLASPLSMG
jgi:hypothetical protein